MPVAQKGEIWQTDLGLVAKVRPCLMLTDPPADDELALVTVCHHTTALRGNRWEISIPKPFLKEGAFHLQQINTISTVKLMRRLGELTPAEWGVFYDKFFERFGDMKFPASCACSAPGLILKLRRRMALVLNEVEGAAAEFLTELTEFFRVKFAYQGRLRLCLSPGLPRSIHV